MVGTSHGNSILDDYANLSINDEGEDGLILEESSEEKAGLDYTHCLVGRVLTNRKVNFLAMQDTLSSIWRPVKGVFMEATSYPNIFLFKFFHDLDVRRVLEDGPWTFSQQTLIVKSLKPKNNWPTSSCLTSQCGCKCTIYPWVSIQSLF